MPERPRPARAAHRIRAITVALAAASGQLAVAAQVESPPALPARPAPDARMYQANRWVRFDVESGLPSADVHDVVDATDGRVWAATAAGLAVYDGFRWRAIGRALGLPRIRPQRLLAGPAGRMFVALGTTIYVGDERGFEALPTPAGAVGVSNAVVLADGEVLLRIEDADGGRSSCRTLASPDMPLALPPGNSLGRLETDAAGRDAWFAASSGLYRWDAGAWALAAPVPAEVDPQHLAIQSRERLGIFYTERPLQTRGLWEWASDGSCRPVRLGDERALGLELDLEGDAYACYRSGLIVTRRDGQWFEIEPLPREMFGVNAIRARTRGELWSATESGLFLYRPDHPYWSSVELGADRGALVLETLRARTGDTWLGTGAGLVRVAPSGEVERIDPMHGPPLVAVTGLAEDVGGRLWAGSGSGAFSGLWCLADGAWEHIGTEEGFPAEAVHKIRVDRRGRPWFLGIARDGGGDEPGAFVLSESGFERWGPEQGLASGRAYDFLDTGDAYWFATLSGISRWRRGEWKHWTRSDGLRTPRVYVLAADGDGRVWFGHGKGGVGLGVIEDDSVSYLEPEGAGLDVSFIAQDGERLWVGSETRGLFALREGEWTQFGLSEGLVNRRLTALGLHGGGLFVGNLFGGLQVLDCDPVGFRGPSVTFEYPVVNDRRALLRWHVATHWSTYDASLARVRHRVNGGEWSGWGPERALRTDTLDFGEYAFELEVRDFFGRVVPVQTAPRFVVPTPLHRQARFFLPIGSSLALLALACGMLLARSRREKGALRDSEERFRELAENIREVFWLIDSGTGDVLYVSPAYESAWGASAREFAGHAGGWGSAIHAEDRDRVLEGFQRAGDGGFDEEYRIVLTGGSVRWVHDRAYPIRDGAGGVYRLAGVTEDVTDERRSADRQRLLGRELDHRVKNNLAGVIALAQQTLARTKDLASFERAFTGRLHAMARTHEALSAASWDGLPLRRIVRSVLAPFATTGSETVTIEGPEVFVSASAAMPLSGALHELATNSAKHGALCVAGGEVRVEWREEEGSVRIHWSEAHGPDVREPLRLGLGTTLVHGLVEYELSGSVDFQFLAQGLVCEIDLPAGVLGGVGAPIEPRTRVRSSAPPEPSRGARATAKT